MNNKVRQMTYAALLIGLAIIIPLQFGFLRIYYPPFSATVASHVPMFISMLISPMVAVVVGVGSGIGFLLAGTDPAIVARAFTHIIVGYIGALIIMKSQNYKKAALITAPVHGIAEAIAVIPFIGFNIYYLLVVVLVFSMVHHLVDSAIAYVIAKSVAKASRKNVYDTFGEYENKHAA